MSLHVDHSEIARFADDHVNLKRDDVKTYRAQVGNLRDRIEALIVSHPELALVKTQLSGSLAKGTALKALDDIDLALYISHTDAPTTVNELIPWLAERLRKVIPNFSAEQVTENPFTVTVEYKGSGLKVDVVPVFYAGDADGRGYMVSKDTGEKVLTSIPLHLEFIRKRKDANKDHYAQVVRLVKYWVKRRKLDNKDFRFKSFMVELYVAHLADRAFGLDHYPDALAQVFAHIAKDGFVSPVVFDDHYHPSVCATSSHPIRIWDPVNHENNVAQKYSDQQRDAIVEAALDAGDAIAAAKRAVTKGEAVRYWQKVFGPAFTV
ncbi:MAG TPA: CBASS oligonucleotide cyclase [Candidatus Paceibacterota bacterium]